MAAFSLQPALDLAERRAEAKSRLVRLAYVDWLNARTRLIRLEQRRHLYGGELVARMRQGCTAGLVLAGAEALQRWQAERQVANRELERCRREWQLALEAWQVERKRVEALQLLARRHAEREAREEEKRERRLHDELSARSAHARGLGPMQQAATPERILR